MRKMLLIGKLVGDPELVALAPGEECARFWVEVNDAVSPDSGDAFAGHVERFPVIASHQLARRCALSLRSGCLVFVEGEPARGERAGLQDRAFAVMASEVLPLSRHEGGHRAPPPGTGKMRVFSITRPTVMGLVAALNRVSASHPVPFVGFPTYPLWIELAPLLRPEGHPPFQAAGIRLSEHALHCQLFSTDAPAMTLTISLDGWLQHFELPSLCQRSACPHVANGEAGGVEYSGRQLPARLLTACPCASQAATGTQLLMLLAQVCAVEDIDMELTAEPPPLWRRFRAHADPLLQGESQPYAQLSLFKRVPHMEERPAARDSTGQAALTGTSPQREILDHFRFLIPGAGKPWRAFKIVHVMPSQAGQHADDV